MLSSIPCSPDALFLLGISSLMLAVKVFLIFLIQVMPYINIWMVIVRRAPRSLLRLSFLYDNSDPDGPWTYWWHLRVLWQSRLPCIHEFKSLIRLEKSKRIWDITPRINKMRKCDTELLQVETTYSNPFRNSKQYSLHSQLAIWLYWNCK